MRFFFLNTLDAAVTEVPEVKGHVVPTAVGVPVATGLTQADYTEKNDKHLKGAADYLKDLLAKQS